MIKALVFDWGGTVMKDFGLPGPMYSWKKLEWVENLEEMLKYLSAQYTCVIATNADQSNTEDMKKALQKIGAKAYFKHFFSSKDLGYKKPDVLFFRSILDRINMKPGQTIMIGNDYDKDIVGAAEAGMHTIFYNPTGIFGSFEMADAVIHDMDELIDTVKWYEK